MTLHLPKLVPSGESYVRVPCSKRAAMRVILETVQRGSRYWTEGTVRTKKALAFAQKMAERYDADASQGQRAWAKRQGRANTSLIIYPESHEFIRFWLLVTPGTGRVHEEEHLRDAWLPRRSVTWGTQYELDHVQKPKVCGGHRVWTWMLATQRFLELKVSIERYAAAHGKGDRRDDLDSLVSAIQRMPGFHGVRTQQWQLFKRGEEVWNKHHRETYSWPPYVPYLDKSWPCYHRPEPLRLDALVRMSVWALDEASVTPTEPATPQGTPQHRPAL